MAPGRDHQEGKRSHLLLRYMLDEVRRFVRRERMLEPGRAVRVAVSGGVDSMVLLHVLRELGHPCEVLHVDHGLRGAESDGDRAFVLEHCSSLGVGCLVKQVDVNAHADANGLSIQMAARELRYAWFAELGQVRPMPIALAHHADDAVETLFINLLRGTGAGGWSSIRPVSGVFIRPLLCVGKHVILQYAKENGIPFREDSSNRDPKYLRNRIRRELVPLLEDLRPGASRTIARSLDMLRELEDVSREAGAGDADGMEPAPDGSIHLSFERLERSKTPGLLLHGLLRKAGFHPDVFDRIRDAVDERATGRVFVSGDRQVMVGRDALVIGPVPGEQAAFTIDAGVVQGRAGPFTWSFSDAAPRTHPNGMREVWLDADRLAFPLVLRPWRDGDRMRPLGLGGSKLVSDILTDAKVPAHEKALAHVLESDGTLVWLAGHRLADGFQATEKSRHVLRVALDL